LHWLVPILFDNTLHVWNNFFMAAPSRKRVVALLRISTLKQIKDKEADYQRNQIRMTCSLKNLELVKEFPLENISGLHVRHTDQFRALKNLGGRSKPANEGRLKTGQRK